MSNSNIKDAYDESVNPNSKDTENDNEDIENKKNKTENLQKELFKDRDNIRKLFEDYKLIILSIALFIFIVFIIKSFSKNK